MKINLLFVAVSGLALVSASPPGDPIPWEDEESLRGYPPCSESVTDRCIQSYERGIATRENLARNDELGTDTPGAGLDGSEPEAAEYASAQPAAARSDYPPCSRTVTDRCTQTRGGASQAGASRMARTAAPKHRQHADRPTQLAMRAGERG